MSSIQASASSAIAKANGAMSSAQFSASLSQAANEQARQSQVSAITATQASLAIVGSIIASTLLTTLIFFLVSRHRKRSKRNKPPPQDSMRQIYPSDPKSPGSDRSSSTTSYSQKRDRPRRQNSKLSEVSYPDISITLGKATEARKPESGPRVKETSVLWNPRNPPQAPTLRSWLKLQDSVSPFGPLKLPIDENAKGPLGGQLKSPLRSIERTPSPKLASSPKRNPKIPILEPLAPIELKAKSTANENPTTTSEDDNAESTLVGQATTNRESQTTIWTDEVPSTYHVTTPAKYQKTPRSTARAFEMGFPMPDKPSIPSALATKCFGLEIIRANFFPIYGSPSKSEDWVSGFA
ncbi:hypothetical protein CJF30_00006869 [Rutstroemia sp. NJR-2017a BBW]|nr:hypothetical protein CJF30_00006869 [Rutstroemia sp. NJR-2017a BBW]